MRYRILIDGAGRWKAGEIGEATENDSQKYAVRLDLGDSDPSLTEGMAMFFTGGRLRRIYYFHADEVELVP